MSLQTELEAIARFPVNTTAGRDDKAWAKRILYREEQGDTTLMSIQVRFAREALNRTAEAK